MKVKSHTDAAKAQQIVEETKLDPQARAETLAYVVAEMGLDTVPMLTGLIQQADLGRKKKSDDTDRPPLQPMRFFKSVNVNGQPYAVVTGAQGSMYLPCADKDVDGLEFGDRILVDQKNGKLAGRDGAVPFAGDVVPIDSLSGDGVLVKFHEQDVLAHVPESLRNVCTLNAGQRVVFDSHTRFIDQVVDSESNGEELLMDLDSLESVSRDKLGGPHPILDEILFRIKQEITDPEWAAQMEARPGASFMFTGPTGTGKTMHLKVLAREVTDFIEDLTGQRLSRLVVVDAGDFYSPMFGTTESKIKTFFERINILASQTVRTRDGREIRLPLIVAMEECESLLRARGEQGGSSHLFDRPLSMILARISSLGRELNTPIYFVASSNRPDLLDSAAKRRIGMRHEVLGSLTAGQAAAVLETKLTVTMAYRDGGGEEARAALINQVLNFLYTGDDAEQGVAEVRLLDSNRRTLCRRHMVTGSMLEEAVSFAVDECLRQSQDAGRLLGIDAAGVIRSLQNQYISLANTLRPQNLPEHCPQWFAEEPLRVEHVRPLVSRNRRPTGWAMT